MRCPHLVEWVISSCAALNEPYVPSIFELKEYCLLKDHKKCLFYMKDELEKDGSRMAEFKPFKDERRRCVWA